jgi:hypothetical protein
MTQQSLFDDESFDEGDLAHQNAVAAASHPDNPLRIHPSVAAHGLRMVKLIKRARETGIWNDRRINEDATGTPDGS